MECKTSLFLLLIVCQVWCHFRFSGVKNFSLILAYSLILFYYIIIGLMDRKAIL